MVIGGTLALHVGPRMATFHWMSGVALSYWSIKHSLFSFFITYGFLFGLGQGIAYVVAVATIINWAPEKVGLMSGIVAAGFGNIVVDFRTDPDTSYQSGQFAIHQGRVLPGQGPSASSARCFSNVGVYLCNHATDWSYCNLFTARDLVRSRISSTRFANGRDAHHTLVSDSLPSRTSTYLATKLR
ncbi:hypothetical protein COOONC_13751 [Cooperia oncophora]